MLVLTCPKCKRQLTAAEDKRGEIVVCNACNQKIRLTYPTAPHVDAPTTLSLRCPTCETPLMAPSSMRGKVVECRACSQKIRLARESSVQENALANTEKSYDQVLAHIQTEYEETLQTIAADHAEAQSNICADLEDRLSELNDKIEEIDNLCDEMRDTIEEREEADDGYVNPHDSSVCANKESTTTAKRNMHMCSQTVVCPTCKEKFSISYGIGEVENERKEKNEAVGCMAALGMLFFWPLLAGAAYYAVRKPKRTVLCKFCGRAFEVSLQ